MQRQKGGSDGAEKGRDTRDQEKAVRGRGSRAALTRSASRGGILERTKSLNFEERKTSERFDPDQKKARQKTRLRTRMLATSASLT